MRRHRNIASYEIYNEENVAQWWDGSAAAYSEMVRRGSEVIRAAAPGIQVLLGGMVFPDNDWVEHVCTEGGNGRPPPEVGLEHYFGPHFLDGFVRTVDQECGRKPIWINESGFATVAGKSEQDQADWWMSAIAVFAATPRVEHIGVYEIKDLASTREAIGDAPNYHLGITRADRTKKPAFDTIRRMVRFFERPFSVDEARVTTEPDGGMFAYAFRRDDGRRLLVTWVKRGRQTGRPHVVELGP